jgi:hypothetical protein
LVDSTVLLPPVKKLIVFKPVHITQQNRQVVHKQGESVSALMH